MRENHKIQIDNSDSLTVSKSCQKLHPKHSPDMSQLSNLLKMYVSRKLISHFIRTTVCTSIIAVIRKLENFNL